MKNSIHRFIYDQHWTIGFIESPVSDLVNSNPVVVNYVLGMPHDRWFADPFILDFDDQVIQVMVEEYNYKSRRGRIAKLSIDRIHYRLLGYKIILDLPTHLSFPFIERRNGKIYLYPENSASGAWNKYEYNPFTEKLTIVETITRRPVTDAIITDLFGEDLIFTTQVPTQNGNILSVYDENGTKIQDVQFSSNIARNAGTWFRASNHVYRPAQDCNDGYGRAVIIQEVSRTNNQFVFSNVCRIVSTHPRYSTGCHTLNSLNNLSVIDVHGWRRPLLVKFFILVRKLIGFLKK